MSHCKIDTARKGRSPKAKAGAINGKYPGGT